MGASVILQSETMDIVAFVTARKRSLRRLCFTFVCHSVHGGGGGGGIPEYIACGIRACLAGLRGWYASMPCRSQGGGMPACLAGLQAHTQGGS